MEWVSDLIAAISNDESSIWIAPGVIQSLFASVIASVVSLMVFAPVTAWLVQRRVEANLKPLRSSVERELRDLIRESVQHLVDTGRNIELDNTRIDENPDQLQRRCKSAADSIHIFCENQLARIRRFRSIFELVSEGVDAQKRFEIAEIFQSIKLFDEQFCAMQSSAALEVIKVLRLEDPKISTQEFLGFRSIHEAYLLMPSSDEITRLSSLSGQAVKDTDTKETQSSFIDFVVRFRDLLPEEWMKDDLVGKRWISRTHDVPALVERNRLMH